MHWKPNPVGSDSIRVKTRNWNLWLWNYLNLSSFVACSDRTCMILHSRLDTIQQARVVPQFDWHTTPLLIDDDDDDDDDDDVLNDRCSFSQYQLNWRDMSHCRRNWPVWPSSQRLCNNWTRMAADTSLYHREWHFQFSCGCNHTLILCTSCDSAILPLGDLITHKSG